MRRFTNAVALATLLLAAITIPSTAQNPKHDARYFVQQARQAYHAKDYAAMVANMKTALEMRPTHQTYIYYLAVAYALTGEKAKALSLLSDAVSMGLTYNADHDPDLASLKDSDDFKRILSGIEKNRLHIGHGSSALTVPEKDLIPEGLAYDPVKRVFFIGSVYRRKIVIVDRSGAASDFSSPDDGLWSVMGMKVDSKRRLLWVCTTGHPQMSNYTAADNGRSGIFKYDLNTRKLLKKYLLPNKPDHWLGDLTLNSHGDVFATDSLSPAIYFIDPQTDELKLFFAPSDLVSLQGLAFTPDDRQLLFADYSLGLFSLNVNSKKLIHLSSPPHTTLLGIDGLYSAGKDLIAVQNGIIPNRIVRIAISADSRSITRVETLEANHPLFDEPTLGVVAQKQFYVIANSQWGMIDKDGHIPEPDKLKQPAIVKIALVKD